MLGGHGPSDCVQFGFYVHVGMHVVGCVLFFSLLVDAAFGVIFGWKVAVVT